MQESYGEDLANHPDPESCAVARKGGREALTGAWAGELYAHGCRTTGNSGRDGLVNGFSPSSGQASLQDTRRLLQDQARVLTLRSRYSSAFFGR